MNVVPGYGNVAGQVLAEHPGVDKIAFTGSTATGRKIVQASAGNLKRVQLELGGKGANIVFDDANLLAAVNGSAFAIFHNQGQACIAGSRLILHEKIAEAFLDKFLTLARSIRLGNPLEPATEMGPLTSTQHRDRVFTYVKVAREDGGEVLLGGKAPERQELAKGCYVEPTIVFAPVHAHACRRKKCLPSFRYRDHFPRRRRGHRHHAERDSSTAWAAGYGPQSVARASRVAAAMRRHGLDQLLQARQPRISVRRSRGRATDARWASRRCNDYTEAKSVWVNVDAQIPLLLPALSP
jgi:hypothetical protein